MADGHILSHWGLVPKGHALDLSLALVGVILYSAYFLAGCLWDFIPFRKPLFLIVATAGACFSCCEASRGSNPHASATRARQPLKLYRRARYQLRRTPAADLLYVLKFILGDFCIVCTGFHCVNFTMFAQSVFEYRSAPKAAVKSMGKKL